MKAEEALNRLIEGNRRFVSNCLLHPNCGSARRGEIRLKQNPFAVVVGCSDSRVPPEIIFDQGLGDLFTIRVAGNVVGDLEMKSIEFAMHFMSPALVLVLGHESCNVIQAIFDGDVKAIGEISKYVKAPIGSAKNLQQAVIIHVKQVRDFLKNSLSSKILGSEVAIYGAYYQLSTGSVEILADLE